MTVLDRQELERVRYWQGQRLRASDFTRQVSTDAQLRAWHNRALHHAQGIASGFAVSMFVEGGAPPALLIEPGLAYDRFGLELILPSPRLVAIPPAPASGAALALLVTYRHTTAFEWKVDTSFEPADGVPLARVSYLEGSPTLDLTFAPDRTRALARPHLARGSTIPGATVWDEVDTSNFPSGHGSAIAAIETIVETSAAGFERTPCYFASAQALEPVLVGFEDAALFACVLDPAVDHFTFRLMLVFESQLNFAAAGIRLRAVAERSRPVAPHVCWLGCETRRPAEPSGPLQRRHPCCS